MKLELVASLAVLFGSLYTVFRKFQFVVDLKGTDQQFNQPMFQAFIIFVGMTTIYFFRPIMPKDKDEPEKKPQSKYLYFLPSLLDVIGTIFDTTGLYYTSVSVSQMLKGAALFFTYLITVGFKIKTLTLIQHFWMCVVVLSLSLIGYSNLQNIDFKYQANPLLGNFLVVMSQLVFALMFITEQKITKKYNVRISNVVLWQGIWGVIISGSLLIIFSSFKSDIIRCDVYESCSLIYNNWKLLGSLLITAFCIAPFNYFGLMITKDTSALQRCLVCTSRMILVWIVSLVFRWEEFSWMQLIGYLLLTYSIYRFNLEQIMYTKLKQINQEEQSISTGERILQTEKKLQNIQLSMQENMTKTI